MNDASLTDRLRAAGYTVDDQYLDGRTGKMLLVVSGSGVERCAVFFRDAEALLAGRTTLEQLAAQKGGGGA